MGIPIFGGVLNAGLAGEALDPSTVATALRPVFVLAVLVGVVSTVFALRLPERPLREHTAFDEHAPRRPPDRWWRWCPSSRRRGWHENAFYCRLARRRAVRPGRGRTP